MGSRRAKNAYLQSTLTALVAAYLAGCAGSVAANDSSTSGNSKPSSTRDDTGEDIDQDDSLDGDEVDGSTSGDSLVPPALTTDVEVPGAAPTAPTFAPNPAGTPTTEPDALSPPDRTITSTCNDDTLRGADNSGIRKLTKTGLLNSLRSVFAEHDWYELENLWGFRDFTYVTFDQRDPMQIAFNQYPEDFSFKAGEDFQQTYSRDQLAAWLQLVDIVGSEFAEKGYSSAYTEGDCFEDDATLTCRNQLVSNLGEKAFRRPLTDEEVDSFSLPAFEGTAEEVISAIISRMLQSPQFMYILELTEAEDDAGRARVSAYDVASRLAFSLTDAPPDAELMAAAASGELDDLDGVRTHATRLLGTEDGKKRLDVFFRNWLELDAVSNPPKSWGNFKKLPTSLEGLFNSDKLADLYADEAERYLNYVVWSSNGTFADLMTLPIAFPSDDDQKLRAVYQTEQSTDGEPVSAPLHPGILTRAALLASRGDSPSPIHRGLRVLTRVLCNTVPSPDFTVVASRVERLNSFDSHQLANFEITTQMTEEPACASCHQVINPVGFIFEAYNPLGQRDTVQRVIENVYSFEDLGRPFPETDDGVEYAEFTQFELPGAQSIFIEEGLPSAFETPDTFVQAIGASQSARACLAVRYFRHLNHRNEAPNDGCGVAETANTLKQQSLTEAFVSAVANEDIFWRKP